MEEFFALLLTGDLLIKLHTAALVGLVAAARPEPANPRVYRLSRATGAGEWLNELDAVLRFDLGALEINPEGQAWAFELRRWLQLAKRRTDQDQLKEASAELLKLRNRLLHADEPDSRVSPSIMLRWVIEVRNKTVGHGAAGSEFWKEAGPAVADSVNWLVDSTPLWNASLDLIVAGAHGPVGRVLSTEEPVGTVEAVGVDLGMTMCRVGSDVWEMPPLLWARPSDNHTFVANGSWRPADSSAEFLCHAIEASAPEEGRIRRSLPAYGAPPVDFSPPSETEGLQQLDTSGAVIHNLPPSAASYVPRPDLEAQLRRVLGDTQKRHLINVKGIGGIGKTTLILTLAHELAVSPECPYSQIIWISARDVDLTMRGPKAVRQMAHDLSDVWRTYATLWGGEESQAAFEKALRDDGAPVLLIVDNFETFADQDDSYGYLDDVVHPPSKIVITSRHDFKGDFQIPVRGMERGEATKLIQDAARTSHREGLITEKVLERIFDKCQGHAYAMKLVASNIESEAGLSQLLSGTLSDVQLLDALFRQSAKTLDDGAEFVFLIAGRYPAGISEAALAVATRPERMDLPQALRVLHERSLLEFDNATRTYVMPTMAREFAARLLTGHIHATAVRNADDFIKRWPALFRGAVSDAAHRMEISIGEERTTAGRARILDAMKVLTEYDGGVWEHYARALHRVGASADRLDDAYKRAVEENPADSRIFLEWAAAAGDADKQVQLNVQAVNADPNNFKVASSVARFLVELRSREGSRYEPFRWLTLMRPVAEALQRHVDRLDANDLSRLGSLYLSLGDSTRARATIKRGQKVDSENPNIVRLASSMGMTHRV